MTKFEANRFLIFGFLLAGFRSTPLCVKVVIEPFPRGHFRVHLSLHFKARLSAKSLL